MVRIMAGGHDFTYPTPSQHVLHNLSMLKVPNALKYARGFQICLVGFGWPWRAFARWILHSARVGVPVREGVVLHHRIEFEKTTHLRKVENKMVSVRPPCTPCIFVQCFLQERPAQKPGILRYWYWVRYLIHRSRPMQIPTTSNRGCKM